ncbi:MAG: hypothetical protein LBN39_09155, partial [Planctomycetaceae bacterium]|nr:hypothetical protein [Planctomycetaceae bacterium]
LGLPFNAVKPAFRESGMMFRPLRLNSMFAGAGSVALAGEAAGLISPSSAEGIGPALKSAYLLAQSFDKNGGLNIEKYRKKLLALRWNLYCKNLKIPAMFCPPLRRLAMRSGLTAVVAVRAESG